MRKILSLPLLIALALIPTLVQAQTIKVTLLGTGTPLPDVDRFGPGTLVEAGGEYFLFDCGRGVSQRLWQKKIQLAKVNKMFLTHLHSDHVVGIPDFWLAGWLPMQYGQRKEPLQIYGPSGTAKMMESLEEAYKADIDGRRPGIRADSGIMVLPKDIGEGIVWDEKGIKITAFLVDHDRMTALGYRFDYAGHSVVISGDTKYSENLVKYAKGTDVLIHEVALARPELVQKSETARRILSSHISPEIGGAIFSQVNPKLAVYSHILLISTDPSISPPTTDDLIPRTRVNYEGPLVIGEDLMSIEIAGEVSVHKFPK